MKNSNPSTFEIKVKEHFFERQLTQTIKHDYAINGRIFHKYNI